MRPSDIRDPATAPQPRQSQAPRLLTIAETVSELNVSRRTVWRLIAAKDLAIVRLGRAVRITAVSIDKLIEKGGSR